MSGLNFAAQCRQMNIPALVIERTARIGDAWRKRYRSLALHTPKHHHQCKFSSLSLASLTIIQHAVLYQPFPSTWPEYTPRDKLVDWMESYAVHQDITYWLEASVAAKPEYDSHARRWDVTVIRGGTSVQLYPAHIVLATGVLGAPFVPTLEHQNHFRGPILHGSDFVDARPFVGKRVVVVGAGNTSSDICQDLALGGTASVTMVQRSASIVVSRSSVAEDICHVWVPGEPVEVGDFKFAAQPLGFVKEIMRASQAEQWAREKELHNKLRQGGVKLYLGPNGEGQYLMVFARAGGDRITVLFRTSEH
jgi:cation diffusion facilitator CzcD-associated flavoprotein CzcO